MGIQITKKAATKPYEQHLVSVPSTSEILVEKVSVHKGEKTTKVVTQKEAIEHPGVIASASEMFRLEVQGGSTINLGNYESARIGVHLSIPCTKNTMEETYKFATDWIGGKIEAAIKDAKA